MNLGIHASDLISNLGGTTSSLWAIIAIALGIIAAPLIIRTTRNIFTQYIGDNFRVWNWRRKGWMEPNSFKFTDKMLREYKPPRKRRY